LEQRTEVIALRTSLDQLVEKVREACRNSIKTLVDLRGVAIPVVLIHQSHNEHDP
jgi:hypothetical protein